MIRFDPDEIAEMSEEKRFYYLRLMAKPNAKPIKTKFVTWSADDQATTSRPDDTVLDSQAMRVVRTIGQAFEVCHKVAQEQMSEKHEDEGAKKGRSVSLMSEEDVPAPLDVIDEKGASELSSRSQSPMEPPSGPLYGRRMSLFQPRKASSASSSTGTVLDTLAPPSGEIMNKEVANPNNPLLQQQMSTTSSQPTTSSVAPAASHPPPLSQTSQHSTTQHNPQSYQQMGMGTYPGASLPTVAEGIPQGMQQNPMSAYPGSSSTLPHSRTWAASQSEQGAAAQPIGHFPSSQSVQSDQPHQMYYPMPQMMSGNTGSLPYGLASPVMVSPYATLQLGIPQYNQQLIRSQLDQAQQSAQVAGCQVQLLRDQLTSETTARLEAQSRTHQLLSANRELLEQVQNLVQRLQSLETKITSEIQQTVPPHSTTVVPSSSDPARHQPQPMTSSYLSYHEQFDARLGTGPVRQNLPYQVQTLADLRAGSLPPVQEKPKRSLDDGARTEPESNAEDTTDYSSSDQYEKTSNLPKSANLPAHYNVLMSNPLADLPIPSYAGSSVPLIPTISQLKTEAEEENKSDDDQQPGPSTTPPKKMAVPTTRTGILRGEKEFSRLSFNTKIKPNKEPELDDIVDDDERPAETSRRDEKRRKERITVDSLFKPPTDASPEREPARKVNVPTSMPASSSIVTAMYPPVRKPVVTVVKRPQIDVVRKKTLRALSVELDEDDDDRNQNRPSNFSQKRRVNESGRGEMEDFLNRNLEKAKLSDPGTYRHRVQDGKVLPNGYP